MLVIVFCMPSKWVVKGMTNLGKALWVVEQAGCFCKIFCVDAPDFGLVPYVKKLNRQLKEVCPFERMGLSPFSKRVASWLIVLTLFV